MFLLLAHCCWSTELSAAPATRGVCCRYPAPGLCPLSSKLRFLSWVALAAWLLSGPHFYLVSWPACPGKLPSPGQLVKLSGWPAFPFPFLSFSPLLTHGVCWLPLFISPCLCASHSFLRFALIHSVFAAFLFFVPLLFCCFASLYPCFLHTCSLKAFCSGFPLPTSSIFSRAYCLSSFFSSDLAAALFETVTNRTLIHVAG